MNRVKIWGGLGNQFFQYAFAKEIEYKNGKEVQLVKDFYESEVNQKGEVIPTRCFLLDKFNCSYEVVPDGDMSRCSKVVLEKDYNLEEEHDDTYFIGYWQSERFFKNVRKSLLNDFLLRDEHIDDLMNETVKEMDKTESVSVHVRRTDYITLGTYPICGREYYERAVKTIIEKTGRVAVLFVFSDDLKWCYDNMDGICGCKTIFVNTGVDYKDWYIMNKAKHFVIANSSFSFWAAYTRKNNSGIVIAPKNWARSGIIAPVDVKEWMYI